MWKSVKAAACAVFLVSGVLIQGASIDTKAKAVRAYAGASPVIKCGPKAVGDVMLPVRALSVLKNGSTLQLMPGSYDGDIVITANKVLVIGDGSGKKCDVDIKISGRKCAVKNIWIGNLHAKRDIIVVDSVISTFFAGYGAQARGKLDQSLFNTCLTAITPFWDNSKITLKNCTLLGVWGGSMCPVDCGRNTRITIINSVLHSPSMLFLFTDYSSIRAKSKGKLVLDGCVVFGKSGLGRVGGLNSSSARKKLALNLKELKRIGNVALKRDTRMEMPIFLKSLKFSHGGSCRQGNVTLENFILTKDSPGQGKGVDVATNFILSKHVGSDESDAGKR